MTLQGTHNVVTVEDFLSTNFRVEKGAKARRLLGKVFAWPNF